VHANFIAHVRARRGTKLDEGTDYFNGDVWVGQEAVDLGLADAVGHLTDEMKRRHGEKTRFALYGPRRSFLRRLGMEAAGAALGGLEERALWARYGL
jgi:serine protease SohB